VVEAGQSIETGCGWQRPAQRSRVLCVGDAALFWCEQGEPMDGGDQTVVCREAVSFP
jgi:hypothetical protein